MEGGERGLAAPPAFRYPESATNSGAKNMVIGIPWCREEDYDAFRAMFEDRDNLPLDWDKFVCIAQKAERLYRSQREIVERVYIDPNKFRLWCAENGLRVDRAARLEFAYRSAVARHPEEKGG